MLNDDQKRLVDRIQRLSPQHLAALERQLAEWEQTDQRRRDWPRAPIHRLSESGTFLVTAGTLYKEHYFRTADQLDLLEAKLLELARHYGWELEAWAVFSNHYHFVGHSQPASTALSDFLDHLHSDTAREINERDSTTGRQFGYNFWETKLLGPIPPGHAVDGRPRRRWRGSPTDPALDLWSAAARRRFGCFDSTTFAAHPAIQSK